MAEQRPEHAGREVRRRTGACPSRGRRSGRRARPRARATSRRPCRAPGRTPAPARTPGAPRRRATAAISAVPSFEAASTTRIWSIRPSSALQLLDDLADRVRHLARGQHHRDALPLALLAAARAGSRSDERSGSPVRTMPIRGHRAHVLPLGGASSKPGADDQLVTTAREGARRGVPAPMPDDLHPALLEALGAAGIEQLWSHQADTLEAARRGHTIVTTGTASGKSLAFNLPVLDTLATDPRRPRALPLPDQGARPGPGARARAHRRALPAPRDLRRRHAEGGAARDPPALEPDPHQPGHAPRRACCPTTPRGATCSPTSPGSWSTRRTSTAACSARTWPTCCAGCAGWRSPTAPSRASCSRARRSPTRSSWPSG